MSGPIMPVPNLGKGCPSGYNQNSNGMCVPTSSATPLVQAVGTSCPQGYNYNSSGYCVGTKKNSPAAYLHGGGQCATGYTRSNHHCRENVVKKKIICDYFNNKDFVKIVKDEVNKDQLVADAYYEQSFTGKSSSYAYCILTFIVILILV